MYIEIEEAARGTPVESTSKSFSHRKDRRGDFQALISNHAGDVKPSFYLKESIEPFAKHQVEWPGLSP